MSVGGCICLSIVIFKRTLARYLTELHCSPAVSSATGGHPYRHREGGTVHSVEICPKATKPKKSLAGVLMYPSSRRH
jgi:hypothetical protein